MGVTFEEFTDRAGPRLRAVLSATYGPEVGADAAAAALAYGWEHWGRVGAMDNPAGYLYRVGQSEARKAWKPQGYLPAPAPDELPAFEPALVPALEELTEAQRAAVVMVHALGWPQVEAAEALGIDPSTLRTHLRRALDKLKAALEVNSHV